MLEHSLFLQLCARVVLCSALSFAGSAPGAAEPALPTLHVYTEVRDGSELVTDEAGHLWVDNNMSRLVEAVLRESGLSYQVTVVPWNRMMNTLMTEANSLAYPVLKIPERESRFRWVGQMQPVDAYLFGLRSRAAQLPDTLEAAREMRIGTMRGDAFHNFLEAQQFPNIVVFGNNTPWLSMLERNRIDLMPFSLSGIEAFLERAGRPDDTLIPAIKLDALSYPLYFVMNLNSDPQLVEMITQAYRNVVQNGTFESIMGIRHPGF